MLSFAPRYRRIRPAVFSRLLCFLWHIPALTTAIRRINRRILGLTPRPRNATIDVLHDTQQHQQHREGAKAKKVKVHEAREPDDHLIMEPLPLTKPGEDFKVAHWAGHLPASADKQKYFFYWLFEPEGAVDENTPLLIWLNGGPACSSMDGLFLENGPIQWTIVDGKYMLQQNPYSWHKAPAYTLYIDQPVGTGLSFTLDKEYPTNDHEVNTDFYYFLTSFFRLHADKFISGGSVSRPVYFSGESHAGHYIPSMMNFILKENREGTWPKIPLAGAAIGNGFFDPMYQYSAAEAAYGHGIIGRAQLYAFQKKEQQCQRLLQQGNYYSDECFALQDDIIDESYGKESEYRVSSYDVRLVEKKGTPRKFPKNHHVTECYLGGHKLPKWETEGTMATNLKDDVLKVLHAEAATAAGQQYEECTDPPYDALADKDGLGVVSDVVQVLQDPSKPRLLFFNGIEDLICNHAGNERALVNLPWHGRDEFETAPRYAWMPNPNDKEALGFMKEHENLMFLKLFHAGHMVPMDLPETSLLMMQLFLSSQSFASSQQSLDAYGEDIPQTCALCPPCADTVECPACTDTENGTNDIATQPPGPPRHHDCSAEVAQATKDLLASLSKSSTKTGMGGALVGGLAMVLVLLVYGITQRRKRTKQRLQAAYAVADGNDDDDDDEGNQVEMQNRPYRDNDGGPGLKPHVVKL